MELEVEDRDIYTAIECQCRYVVVGYLTEIDRKVIIDQDWYCKECNTKLFVADRDYTYVRRIP